MSGYERTPGSGSGASPHTLEVSALATPKSHVGFPTAEVLSGRYYGLRRLNSNALGNNVVYDVGPFAAGTYTFWIAHLKNADRGIATVSVDGVSIGTIDQYAAAAAVAHTAITGVAVSAGLHTVKIEVTGQNASATAVYFELSAFGFTRTGT